MQLKIKKTFSKDLLEMITFNTGDRLYEIISHSLIVIKELWNYLMKQCIGYSEISYSICSLIAK